MATTKPKQYNCIVNYPDFPTDAIQNITQKTGLPLTSHAQKLAEASRHYISDKALVDEMPRRSEAKARLKKIIKSTHKYREVLADTDDYTLQLINLRKIEYVGMRGINETLNSIDGLLSACESALSLIPPDKGGRHRGYEAVKVYCITLAEIYQEVTGDHPKCWYDDIEQKYQGDFLEFFCICLAEIGNPVTQEGSGFGKIVSDVITIYNKEESSPQ